MFALALTLVLQGAAADSARATNDSTRRAQRLETVQVTAIRGGEAAPVAATTVTRAQLERRYGGEETPLLLSRQPSITAYAENGAASNYSYMRLRGMSQNRINLTLDGVPLNEPEDQDLYFSNFPDFANSIESVRIQRGVGTSTHGSASYAGAVSFESIAIGAVRRGGEIQLGRGSFNTTRGSAEYQTGLVNGFAGYGRVSTQQTAGYRANSGNRSRSFFASGGWFGARDAVKVTTIGGISANELAYLAVPASELARDRRANPLGEGENDRFRQLMVSLAWSRALSERTTIATTVYGFDAGGHYDIRFDPASFGNFNLHSRWGGAVGTIAWQGEGRSLIIGANASDYARDHWLNLRELASSLELYANTGHKSEGSIFTKGSLDLGGVTLFGDLQVREAHFRYEPRSGSIASSPRARWRFFNPKVGISLQASEGVVAYLSAGMNGREPTRGDMLAGADNIDPPAESSLLPLTRVKPEAVRDVEIGATWRGKGAQLKANVFVMSFRDELAPIGEINVIGYTLRKNVPRSFRRGIEAEGAWRLRPSLTLDGNVAVTDARIASYRDDASGMTYRDVVPLLTPKVTANHGVRALLTRWLMLDVDGRYVSRMMLTNTNDDRYVVPPGYVADAALTFGAGRQTVVVQVRNLLDRNLPTSGYVGPVLSTPENPAGVESYYYPLAPRNVMITARIGF